MERRVDRVAEVVERRGGREQVGVTPSISASGLKAVETIQKTGKSITTKTTSPTAFHAELTAATAVHAAPSARTILRTYGTESAATIRTMSSEIAAPRPKSDCR